MPEPTDSDWNWWGKLNQDGYGAVVVLRGSGGESRRTINIPWVTDDQTYCVTSLLDGKQLGNFTGRQLQQGAVEMALPVYGQDILELALPQ